MKSNGKLSLKFTFGLAAATVLFYAMVGAIADGGSLGQGALLGAQLWAHATYFGPISAAKKAP
jgi:hypothetical protein